VFFRFTIWLLSKSFPHRSLTRESLLFLLHHPRRCFISLFPAKQTWLLLLILFAMNIVLWAGTLILNIGIQVEDALPIGIRVIISLLQTSAVRSAGFHAVSISSLTPATQVLYVIMMYIAVYPVAMSVRATNVYEESSLGVSPDKARIEEEEENEFNSDSENRVAIWGKYLLRHARRQLSFDIWWLALSLLLLCIIERSNLMNTANATWFNIFSLLFETVSAYGTVGLSLGIPTANYSLSGALHTLSKLILCVVMLRGRHRGLPVALDRAVMLPHEFKERKPATQFELKSAGENAVENSNGGARDADVGNGK